MKVWALSALTAILPVLFSCTDMFRTELDETHSKLEELQKLADSVNNDLKTLKEIVERLRQDENNTIDPSTLVQTDDGYEVSFRDGKKIFIPFGKDGKDGRTLIPVGVRKDEDGLYYWTVDGEDLKDSKGNPIRAEATDGKDGIAPQVIVDENGKWKISVDGGNSFTELSNSDNLDGVGVFSDYDFSDPTKAVLVLLNGTVLEIPCNAPFKMSFKKPDMDSFTIAGGELLPIPYELETEGQSSLPIIVTSGTDGTYTSRVEAGQSPEKGTVYVQAPETFSEGYILLTADCGGYSTIKVISFSERKVTPAQKSVTVRLGSGDDTRTIEYGTNFDYTVSVSEGSWLKVESNPDAGTLTFTASPNDGDNNRTCPVTISPKDNPEYACTTFQVIQATKELTYSVDPDCPFSFDPASHTLDIPSEGGDTDIWISYSSELIATGPGAEWATAMLQAENGFYRLKIHVDANATGKSRDGKIEIKLKDKEITVGDITINQR